MDLNLVLTGQSPFTIRLNTPVRDVTTAYIKSANLDTTERSTFIHIDEFRANTDVLARYDSSNTYEHYTNAEGNAVDRQRGHVFNASRSLQVVHEGKFDYGGLVHSAVKLQPTTVSTLNVSIFGSDANTHVDLGEASNSSVVLRLE